jgi:hypothetical protein
MWASVETKWKLIADNTICRVFSAGVNKGYSYPYRLVSSQSLRPSVRERSLELIVDSGYHDGDVTNKQVIERATDYNVDYLIPRDRIGEPDETVEMMREFFETFESMECRAKPFVVIQPPYEQTLADHGEFYSQFGRFALGGLRNYGPVRQVEELVSFHTALDTLSGVSARSVSIHALGVGLSPEIVHVLRDRPYLVDSLDISTPEMAIKNNQLPDALWKQFPLELPSGTYRRDLQAQYAEATLYMMNYLLGTLVDEDDLYERYISRRVSETVALSDGSE